MQYVASSHRRHELRSCSALAARVRRVPLTLLPQDAIPFSGTKLSLALATMAPISRDTSSTFSNQRHTAPADEKLIAPGLSASPSQQTRTTAESFYTAQSLPSPYLWSPSSINNVDLHDLVGDVPIIALVPW